MCARCEYCVCFPERLFQLRRSTLDVGASVDVVTDPIPSIERADTLRQLAHMYRFLNSPKEARCALVCTLTMMYRWVPKFWTYAAPVLYAHAEVIKILNHGGFLILFELPVYSEGLV